MAQYPLKVNGQPGTFVGDGQTPLLYVLRDTLGLSSPRYGCGSELCGACRVLVDGELAFSCNLPVEAVDGDVTTVEGFAKDSDGDLHALQQAFLDLNAGQCGYCLSGILVTAYRLLQTNPDPSRDDIKQALAPHLCRCGAHNRIISAIQQAARNG